MKISKINAFNAIVTIGSLATSSAAFAQSPYLNTPQVNAPSGTFLTVEKANNLLKSNSTIKSYLNSSKSTLQFSTEEHGELLETIRFQEYYKGLEVIGSQVLVHQGKGGFKASTIIRTQLTPFELDVQPKLTLDEAIAIAKFYAGDDAEVEVRPTLKILPKKNLQEAKLTYWVELESRKNIGGSLVVIDAHSGKIIADIPNHIPFRASFEVEHSHSGRHQNTQFQSSEPQILTRSIRERIDGFLGRTPKIAKIEVFSVTDYCQTVDDDGSPIRVNYANCAKVIDGKTVFPGADQEARNAGSNSFTTLNYFTGVHGRKSYDDKNGNLKSYVHVGKKFDNAFWDGRNEIMAYGDGDGEEFGSFTLALDVAGHEMTHGVISKTAKLIYFDESGALNEAYADFFGKMIEGNLADWTIGKKLYLDQTNAKGFRDLSNPSSLEVTVAVKKDTGEKIKKPYPVRYADRFTVPATEECSRKNDNCWVHVNSTIASHGAYRVLKAIGPEKTEKLYFLTLTQFLTAQSSLKESGIATREACGQIYDFMTCEKVDLALAGIGL